MLVDLGQQVYIEDFETQFLAASAAFYRVSHHAALLLFLSLIYFEHGKRVFLYGCVGRPTWLCCFLLLQYSTGHLTVCMECATNRSDLECFPADYMKP